MYWPSFPDAPTMQTLMAPPISNGGVDGSEQLLNSSAARRSALADSLRLDALGRTARDAFRSPAIWTPLLPRRHSRGAVVAPLGTARLAITVRDRPTGRERASGGARPLGRVADLHRRGDDAAVRPEDVAAA